MSGFQPYCDLPTDHAVLFHIARGGRPIRPNFHSLAVTDGLWTLLTRLWTDDPGSRPEMNDVLRRLNILWVFLGTCA